MSVPTGPIATKSPQGKSFGIAWEDITRYDADLHKAADPVGWPVDRLRGHIVIESQGNPRATQRNPSNGDSFGLFQVVPYGVGWEGWHRQVKELAGLGENASRQRVIDALYDPAVNITVGVAILESFYREHRTLDRASSAFFTGNPTWQGGDSVNGTAGWQYRDCLNALIKEQEAFASSPSATEQDLLALISNNTPGVYVSFGYGELNTLGGSFYRYGVGHMDGSPQHPNIHPGIDIWMPDETPVNAVFGGEVACVGTQGRPIWGQACGAFADDAGGIGNITILTDAYFDIAGKRRQLKMTYGHMSSAVVRAGQRVVAGERIGRSGVAEKWPHIHLDVAISAPELNNPQIWFYPGEYHLVNPLPTMLAAFTGAPIPPPRPVYAERIAIPQPGSFPNWWKVDVIEDGVKVLQSTDPDAPEVHAPLMKGEWFDAVYIVIGQTGEPFWVSRPGDGIEFGSRIPLKGTKLFGPAIFSAATAPDTSDLLDSLYSLQAALGATQRVTDETITELGGEVT